MEFIRTRWKRVDECLLLAQAGGQLGKCSQSQSASLGVGPSELLTTKLVHAIKNNKNL